MNFDETKHLRGRLRLEWPGEEFGALCWVEAARGGSVGAPDVFLPLGGPSGYLPLELKGWKTQHVRPPIGRVQFYARPSQRRFHRLAALAGQRTAFLAVLPTGDVVTIPNWRMPMNGTWMHEHVTRLGSIVRLHALRELYLSDRFWEEGRERYDVGNE